jgi:hypothetical protein
MKDVVNSLTLRSILEFLMPSAYLVGVASALASSCGLLTEYSLSNPGELPDYLLIALDEIVMFAFFSVLVLLVGIFLYMLNLPERLPFYRDALVTVRIAEQLSNKYHRVGVSSGKVFTSQVHKAFFGYFENTTEEQKNRTHKLVNLYSIAINVAAVSLVLVPLSIVAHFVFEADFFENYGLFLVFTLLFSTLSAYGLFFFDGGVKYLFDRQLEGFLASEEYAGLDAYFKENFVQASRKIGGFGKEKSLFTE